MHTTKLIKLALGVTASLLTSASMSFAGQTSIESELSSRPELSDFYSGLKNTGVINELNRGVPYTIFAPTNAAMAKITETKYPCFYSEQCREEAANILRNHIVPQEISFADPGRFAAVSIDGMNIGLSQPRKGDYYVNGHEVVNQMQLMGGVLYEIDGVIASPQELADVSRLKVVPVAVVVPSQVNEETVTKKVYYDSAGDPGHTTTVTTVTKQQPGQVVVVPVQQQ